MTRLDWLAGLRRRAAAADTKASRTAPLIAFQAHGRPVWTPRDYAALAREGFLRNPVVHRSVRLIAESAASMTWIAYDGAAELDAHPLLDLLARPHPGQSGRAFMEAVYGHLLVAGNAWIERVDVDGVPRELHALRPDRVRVVPGPEGWPEAWDYTVGERTHRFLRPDRPGAPPPILQLALFHPLSDHYGLAPLEAAQVSLDVHNAASAWAKALIDNSARPSGALVYQPKDGGNLTDDQFQRLKRELEEGFQGARNAGRPLLLEGGLDWRAMGYSPKDLDFIEAKREAAREIALAFGVPPMLLGIPGDNTYSNYQEANRAFWHQTVLPLAARTADALSAWLSPADRPVRFAHDTDAVEALAADRDRIWTRIAAADFLSEDEKRAAVGYGPRG
ncbi:portal protein [Prosthecomicrobium hirschii]|uniref:Portal protein n=1 Tax=Prosthecodimorpha hirschii TaxID=665126 RepID=A0A0P6VRS0_9HYPH|nr:phage portal protein [Prosthecomicrobium hirschii]KPL54508.1 portal protein [Prosthecomicrobium hirschii]